MNWAIPIFILWIVLQATAWTLEKKGLTQLVADSTQMLSLDGIKLALNNAYLVAGIACTGIAFVCWLYLLSRFNLSHIYPFGSVIYIVVAASSFFILGETIHLSRVVGIIVIAIGCVLINL